MSGDGFAALVAQCLVLGAVCLLILRRHLPFGAALAIVCARFGLAFLYFGVLGGDWRLFDDLDYMDKAHILMEKGYGMVTVFTDPAGSAWLFSVNRGAHVLYSWWTLASLQIFGDFYHSPVLCNILLTFVSGYFFANILESLGFGRQYRMWALGFLLLHWDVVAWSSFIGLKDTMLMTLTVASFHFLIRFLQTFKLVHLAGFSGIVFLFSFLRFYLPFLIITVTGAWMLAHWNDRRKYLLVALVAGVFLFVLPWKASFTRYLTPSVILPGLFRFPLTPQPWSVDEGYRFILFSSAMHWALFLPAVFAAVKLWLSSKFAKLLLLYGLALVALYAMTPFLQGPRHRVQIAFLFCWMQFHFLWTLVQSSFPAHAAERRIATPEALPA